LNNTVIDITQSYPWATYGSPTSVGGSSSGASNITWATLNGGGTSSGRLLLGGWNLTPNATGGPAYGLVTDALFTLGSVQTLSLSSIPNAQLTDVVRRAADISETSAATSANWLWASLLSGHDQLTISSTNNNGTFTFNSTVTGDFREVTYEIFYERNVGGYLFGGYDSISMTAVSNIMTAYGDAWRIGSFGTSILNFAGGADYIYATSSLSLTLVGDVGDVFGSIAFIGGADTIYAAAATGSATVYGDAISVNGSIVSLGNDTISTGSGNDTIYGDIASATVSTYIQFGSDTISAGAGSDTVYADSANANYSGSVGGGDVVYGGAGSDQLYGGEGQDFIYGGSESDRLYGDDGDDILEGGAGADAIYGGAGVDALYYYSSPSGVTIDMFNRVGYGGDANLDSFSGIEAVGGSLFADTLGGDANANALIGFAGNDNLYGFSGDDFIYGGTGNDYVLSGAGVDYVFVTRDEILPGQYDFVGDFQDWTASNADYIYLPAALRSSAYFGDYTGGSYMTISLAGGGYWAMFFSNASSAQVRDQVLFAL
jgi:Ca2+-binding RTX toxin-like protein